MTQTSTDKLRTEFEILARKNGVLLTKTKTGAYKLPDAKFAYDIYKICRNEIANHASAKR